MRFNAQTLSRHFHNHLRDLTCSVTIDATTANGSKGSVRIERLNFEAGVSDTYAFSVWIGADRFAAAPAARSLLTVDSVSYRVGGVEAYPDGAGWRVDLVNPTQPDV
jgi:hypothetical protein